jgi:hypothetical protein
MGTMLNIIRDQDRALRDALRGAERAAHASPDPPDAHRPMPSYSRDPPTMPSASASSEIPYAVPWNAPSLPRRMAPPPPPVEPSRGRASIAERLRRYRDDASASELPSLAEARQRLRDRYSLPSLGDLSPVTVRPTLAQLLAATRTGEFQSIDDAMNTECPITRENFSPTDSVLQILQCRHVFATAAAVRWFDGNTRCPVCRHDVREPLDVAARSGGASSSSVVTPMEVDTQDDEPGAASAARSIARYLSESIDMQMQAPAGSTDSVLIEYGFVVPAPGEGGASAESDSSSL